MNGLTLARTSLLFHSPSRPPPPPHPPPAPTSPDLARPAAITASVAGRRTDRRDRRHRAAPAAAGRRPRRSRNRRRPRSVRTRMFESPFRGSDALAAGHLTRGRLRGPAFRRLFEDVYVRADVPVDLALRSQAAHLLVAGRGVLAGYSAAEILGASCGPEDAPAEVALPAGCLLRQPDLLVHRGLLRPDEVTTVGTIGVTTRARTAYDLARFAPSLVEAVVAVDALATPSPCRRGTRALSGTARRLFRPAARSCPPTCCSCATAISGPAAVAVCPRWSRWPTRWPSLRWRRAPGSRWCSTACRRRSPSSRCTTHGTATTWISAIPSTASASSTTAASTSRRNVPGVTSSASTASPRSAGRWSARAPRPCCTSPAWPRSRYGASWTAQRSNSGYRRSR